MPVSSGKWLSMNELLNHKFNQLIKKHQLILEKNHVFMGEWFNH